MFDDNIQSFPIEIELPSVAAMCTPSNVVLQPIEIEPKSSSIQS
jgi:hypothetical protein